MNEGPSTYLICLNEINFELVKHYCSLGKLESFSEILNSGYAYRTQSESEYELLEPWIQWVTVHTGLDYKEHGVFRLGDIVGRSDLVQLFEYLESKDKSIGAVSPFNAENRLANPAFFVPDPWTQTTPSGSRLLKRLSKTVSLAVNENASGGVGISDAITLAAAIIYYSPVRQYSKYLAMLARIRKPGTKALILDQLLCHVFLKLCKTKNPDFATLFLNSGAHIQHHYMFNSSGYTGPNKNPDWYCDAANDPLEDILTIYDDLIGKLISTNKKVILATGLHQVPHEVSTYYWRLKDHASFLNALGIDNLKAVVPRMSRDFLIEFYSEEECTRAAQTLDKARITSNDQSVFSIDNRGSSLFVELIYPNDITQNDSVGIVDQNLVIQQFRTHVSFVAIKNGEHNGEGYVLSNFDLEKNEVFPLRELRDVITNAVISPH